MNYLYPAGLLALALLAGSYLYHRIAFFQRFLIQPALLAGTALFLLGPQALEFLSGEYYTIWKTWPGYLISFLFAALMLGTEEFKARDLWHPDVLLQGLFVWFIGIGQLALGFAVVLGLSTFMNLDPLLAHVIELGWIGGHGAAGAFKGLFPTSLAGDVALFSATAGLLWGAVSGFFLVAYSKKSYVMEVEEITYYDETQKVVGNNETKSPIELIGEAALPALLVAVPVLFLAVFLAYLWKDAMVAMAGKNIADLIAEVPPFFLAIFTGLFLKMLLDFFGIRIAREMQKINGLVLNALIGSAIAALALNAVAQNSLAFALLAMAGAIWCLLCFFIFARLFLPEQIRLELSILNYGMSTGITALGLLLLQSLAGRIPQKSVRIYGLAAPLSAPFIGGGILSLYVLPSLNQSGYAILILISLGTALPLLALLAFFIKKSS